MNENEKEAALAAYLAAADKLDLQVEQRLESDPCWRSKAIEEEEESWHLWNKLVAAYGGDDHAALLACIVKKKWPLGVEGL